VNEPIGQHTSRLLNLGVSACARLRHNNLLLLERTGEGRGTSPGEVHDIALKATETDATKRALAGKPITRKFVFLL
jgi:hypothetical protein